VEAERTVAAAVLEFLRETPLGDGAGFRSWVATTDPFDDASGSGVELLTFHASKGREWHTVIVAGVEKGLSPHSSATTAMARSEEARLLYVAVTRATDRLLISRAERRGGYQRTPSPFIATIETPAAQPTAPPRMLRRRVPADPLFESLRSWRDDAARRADILPSEVCSDRDLRIIADRKPRTASELVEWTSLGPVTANRLAPQLASVIDAT
jgi:DNA helicase-2/ATP-dependent DNA helicase PcrA